MSKSVIEIRNLGKKYRLGSKSRPAESLFEEIRNIILSPLYNYKRIRSLTHFKNEESTVYWALKNISFSVTEGEVLGVIGHNGAGKSTLLKILSRITEPSEGEALIRGRVASLLEIGTGFHPELTGRENIYMNGTILGMRKKEVDRNLDSIVDFSGIEDYLDTPIKFYSSGMKVRLGFAVAAHIEPEILIVDEVLAVGDLGFQQKCIGKMGEVARNGRTVLFVSHNMDAIQNLCTRAVLLSHGQIKSIGNVSGVIRDYMAEFQGNHSTFLKDAKRVGSGQIQMTNFKILNDQNEEVFSVNSGERVKFLFYLTKQDSSFSDLIDVGFSIHHAEDNRMITVLYSSYTGKFFKPDSHEMIFKCEIEELPLPEGRYLVKAQILSAGQVVDFPIFGICYFNVLENNYFGSSIKSGKLTREKPSLLLRGRWS